MSPASGVTLANGNYKANDSGGNNPLDITYNNGNTYIGACFLAGSMISTPDGDVAVEDIKLGDEVIAFDWKSGQNIVRPIVWTGKTHVNVRHGVSDDMSGFPIRVLKDAIADGVPYKDMLITAEHSLFFDGKFVPARMLVNGRSIFFDKSITSYDYYHVETEQHSVITADGMLTESYLDTGNRHTFRQEGNVVAFTPSRNLTWDDAAAPLGVSREFAEPLFRQAEARAQAAGLAQKEPAVELTDEVNLHLVTDTGAVIRQAREHNGRVMFMIPTGVKNVRIVSNASRPSDVIGPFVDDRRYFGVAVGEITMFEAGRNHSVTAHLTEKELAGWNTLEWEDTRWTSGDALLPLGERHPNSAALLAIQIKKAGPYLASDSADIQSVKTA
ncbi:Hint domain-containing protein [Acetobacter aceti]|uniref:Hint domain-containing protein n=1 Tax=Acetobacter aceti TaxID=435 RepID=UPI001E45B1C4|nr:Hint domain-containing protein [Acetobacter aceti]